MTAPYTYQAGDLAGGANFTVTGGAAAQIDIKSMTLDEESITPEVTNTASNGRTWRIGAKADHKGSLQCSLDLGKPPYLNPPALRSGVTGLILIYVSPTRPIQVPVIITKLHYEYAMETQVKWAFDIAEAGQYGTIVYPAT